MYYIEDKKLWAEYITVDGVRKRITSKDKKELKQRIADYNERVKNGEQFSVVADLWETAHAKKVEATTGSSYTAHVRRAKEFFGTQPVNLITPAQVQAFLDDLGRQGYAHDTVHRARVILNQIFNFAITMPGATLRNNPVTATKTPRGLTKTRREPPTESQLLVVDASTEMGLFACFLLYTGLRRGELLALQWSDIDRDARQISVKDVVQYSTNTGHIKDRPKTEAGIRKIPIPDKLYDVLPTDKRKGYIFGGCKPLSASQFRARWLAWCKEHGLAESEIRTFNGRNGKTYKHTVFLPKVTPHQFRHQYATMLFEAGVDELDAKVVMGHSSITVTKDIYTHIKERTLKSAVADKLNEHLKKQ